MRPLTAALWTAGALLAGPIHVAAAPPAPPPASIVSRPGDELMTCAALMAEGNRLSAGIQQRQGQAMAAMTQDMTGTMAGMRSTNGKLEAMRLAGALASLTPGGGAVNAAAAVAGNAMIAKQNAETKAALAGAKSARLDPVIKSIEFQRLGHLLDLYKAKGC